MICVTTTDRGKPPAALVKAVKPVGEVREVKLARKELAGWILMRAKARGLDVAPPAANAMVEMLGEEPAVLDQATVQLGSAFPQERISRDLVERQFRGLGEQHVWDLCDRAFGKDLAGSITSLRALLEGRDDPLMILGGVASRLRDLLRVRGAPGAPSARRGGQAGEPAFRLAGSPVPRPGQTLLG